MISLSVYGDPTNPVYAAVWVQRSGKAWIGTRTGLSGADYQAYFDKWTAQGFAPVIVSATGPVDNAVFAAVYEQGVPAGWLARHNLPSGYATTPDTFEQQLALAASSNLIVHRWRSTGRQATAYAAVWYPNPRYVKWHVPGTESAADYQNTFNIQTQLPGYHLAGYRAAYIAVSSDGLYASVFKDDVVGNWVGMQQHDGCPVSSRIIQQTGNGFYPICVQGGGVGDQTRYAAIFAQRDMPLPRLWHVSGAAVRDFGYDKIMQTFIKTNGVRAAQLTIGNDGNIKFSRAYTWAESGYRLRRSSDVSLLASLSKMFTEAAIQSLYDANKLTPTTTAYPLLGLSKPADTRSDTITIQQLLDHYGGYDDSSNRVQDFDPTYSMRQVALNLGLSRPVNKLDIVKYLLTHKSSMSRRARDTITPTMGMCC